MPLLWFPNILASNHKHCLDRLEYSLTQNAMPRIMITYSTNLKVNATYK